MSDGRHTVRTSNSLADTIAPVAGAFWGLIVVALTARAVQFGAHGQLLRAGRNV